MTDPNKRQELAREWVTSTTELRSLTHSAHTTRSFIQRARESLTARRNEARVREIRRGLHSTKQYMEYLSVGADSHEWGVFSGGELHHRTSASRTFLLEDTVKEISWSDKVSIDTTNQIRDLLAALPAARANTELGNNKAIADIEARLVALAESPDLEHQQRRRILEHLPARLRPIPKSLHLLERAQPPVTLFISLQGENLPYSHPQGPKIRLHDIVVARELRGKGLGTAALSELCKYADLHDLPIEGMLEPGPREPEEAVAAVSKWYARLGFTQGELEPREWRRGGTIHRTPRPSELGGSRQL